jgi:hypothetical protein
VAAKTIQRVCPDPALEYQLDIPPVSKTEHTKLLEDSCNFNNTSQTISSAIDNQDGKLVGWINLFKGSVRHGYFSFGIRILKDFHGQVLRKMQ